MQDSMRQLSTIVQVPKQSILVTTIAGEWGLKTPLVKLDDFLGHTNIIKVMQNRGKMIR